MRSLSISLSPTYIDRYMRPSVCLSVHLKIYPSRALSLSPLSLLSLSLSLSLSQCARARVPRYQVGPTALTCTRAGPPETVSRCPRRQGRRRRRGGPAPPPPLSFSHRRILSLPSSLRFFLPPPSRRTSSNSFFLSPTSSISISLPTDRQALEASAVRRLSAHPTQHRPAAACVQHRDLPGRPPPPCKGAGEERPPFNPPTQHRPSTRARRGSRPVGLRRAGRRARSRSLRHGRLHPARPGMAPAGPRKGSDLEAAESGAEGKGKRPFRQTLAGAGCKATPRTYEPLSRSDHVPLVLTRSSFRSLRPPQPTIKQMRS